MTGIMKKGAERLQKEILEFQEKKTKHLENVKVFQEQLKKMKLSKAKDDELKSRQVDGVLDDLPAKVSAKGVLEKILKMKTGESAQLVQNLEKLRIAIANEQRKATDCEIQIRQLSKELDDLRFNSQAEHFVERLNAFISNAEKLEVSLAELKQAAASNEDEQWFDRLPKLGFDKVYGEIAANFFTPAGLNRMTSHSLIESILRIGGGKLFKTAVRTGNESSLSLEQNQAGRAFRDYY